MKCPVCNTVDLTMTDRQGIEIDYCPQCRGVWLDRGELDKIIERSMNVSNVIEFCISNVTSISKINLMRVYRPEGVFENHLSF